VAISPRIQEFLRQANVHYSVFRHDPAYTAQEEAAVTHIAGRYWAKTVVCFADGEPIQAVVPAPFRVDLELLRHLTCARAVRLARDEELEWLYPECEEGAMPPLGPLYHQRVFVDLALAAQNSIVFNGGTHNDAVRMGFADFAALTHPRVSRFATNAH
jgi:Ala-tRNA(Pro) deacylase